MRAVLGDAFARFGVAPRTETLTRNLQEDIWLACKLTPVVFRQGSDLVLKVLVPDNPSYYIVDNGQGRLPDGQSIRLLYYRTSDSAGSEVFARFHVPDNPISWQEEAVEELMRALRFHRSHAGRKFAAA